MKNHIMLDLETLSVNPNAVILQIGMCRFDPMTGDTGDEFEKTIDLDSSLRAGFDVDASTIQWWQHQEEKARLSVFNGDMAIETAMWETRYFISECPHIWSHATFDFVLLMNHFRRFNIKPPSYRSAHDIRTLIELAGGLENMKYPKVGTTHTALDDCKYQVQYVSDLYRKIKRGNDEPFGHAVLGPESSQDTRL